LQKIAAYQPWQAGIWEKIGVEALAAEDLETARQAFEKAESRNDISIPGRTAYGLTYWQMEQYEDALDQWTPLMEDGQAEAWLYERAADYWRAAGDQRVLIEVLRNWVKAFPSAAHPAYELAILLLPEFPIEASQQLRAADRNDSTLKGQIYTIEQGLAKAASEPDQAYGQVLLGQALAAAGEWPAAVRSFDRAIQFDPAYSEAWAFLAEARHQIGEDGRYEIEMALAADPQSLAARTLAALYWRRAGQPEKALIYLEELSKENPAQGMWQVEIAATVAEMGEYEQALISLKRAVEIEPGNIEFWRYLGRFCVDNVLEVRETGLPAARQALALAPANPNMLDLMGLVLLQLEDETGAERFLQRAISVDPAHAGAHLHLGQLYLNQSKHQLAIIHLIQARESADTSSPEVQIIARRLIELYYPNMHSD
jgi:tetratricopeptide (TPR) repeat protein